MHLNCVMSTFLLFFSSLAKHSKMLAFICFIYIHMNDEVKKNTANSKIGLVYAWWRSSFDIIIIIHGTFSSNCAYWCDISSKTYSPWAYFLYLHHHYCCAECQCFDGAFFRRNSFVSDSLDYWRWCQVPESMRINVNLGKIACISVTGIVWVQIILLRPKHLIKIFAFIEPPICEHFYSHRFNSKWTAPKGEWKMKRILSY